MKMFASNIVENISSKHMKQWRTHSHNSIRKLLACICCKRFDFLYLPLNSSIFLFFLLRFIVFVLKYRSILVSFEDFIRLYDRFSRWKFDYANKFRQRERKRMKKWRNFGTISGNFISFRPFFSSKVRKLFLDLMVKVAPKRILTLLFDFFFSPLKSSNNIY